MRGAIPPGISLLRRLKRGNFSFSQYQTSVLVLTFIAYTLYHASRKPPSIVKGVLNPYDNGKIPESVASLPPVSVGHGLDGGWAPFSGKMGKGLLGEMDLAFLGSYAAGMYFSGHLGDRMDLRIFLTGGMLGSGLFVCLFGMGYFWGIHSLLYFLLVQMGAGLCQATGWPSVVAIMANWHGKAGRGLVMGIWNSHTSFGNILGSLVASGVLNWGWGWAFIVPGVGIACGGVLLWLFLVPDPRILGLEAPHKLERMCLTEEESEVSSPSSMKIQPHPQSAPCAAAESGVSGPAEPLVVEVVTDRAAEAEESQVLGVQESSAPAPAGGDGKGGCDPCPNQESPKAGTTGHAALDQSAGGEGQQKEEEERAAEDGDEELLLPGLAEASGHGGHAIGFLEAWRIPGVASFALCLFFAKLVAYTFLYWLPYYIAHTVIGGRLLSNAAAGATSTLFDIGGVAGGIAAGHLSDTLSTTASSSDTEPFSGSGDPEEGITPAPAPASSPCRATVAAAFMALSVPSLLLYLLLGSYSLPLNLLLLLLSGFLVNGPYALITCAVSADLGQHPSLHGDARALATVTAIIDGTGSLGAALGPLLTGFLTELGGAGKTGWVLVFSMLMLSAVAAVLCLWGLVVKEVGGMGFMVSERRGGWWRWGGSGGWSRLKPRSSDVPGAAAAAVNSREIEGEDGGQLAVALSFEGLPQKSSL